jgi:hypothetical protein
MLAAVVTQLRRDDGAFATVLGMAEKQLYGGVALFQCPEIRGRDVSAARQKQTRELVSKCRGEPIRLVSGLVVVETYAVRFSDDVQDLILAGDRQEKVSSTSCGHPTSDIAYGLSPRLVGPDAGVDQEDDNCCLSSVKIKGTWQPSYCGSRSRVKIDRNT